MVCVCISVPRSIVIQWILCIAQTLCFFRALPQSVRVFTSKNTDRTRTVLGDRDFVWLLLLMLLLLFSVIFFKNIFLFSSAVRLQ